MGLQSRFFGGDPKLEAAAVSHPAHIVPGSKGAHVGKLQQALISLDGAVIEPSELEQMHYGLTTANAVLAYKEFRKIINPTYQTRADNIVGIMTMTALDREMAQCENSVTVESIRCNFGGHPRRQGRR